MWRTTDSSQCPVPADVRGSVGEFESVGPSIGVEIYIYGCDIDGIRFGALAHFCFLREDLRCVIVYVQQVDLQSTCPTRRGDTCRWTEGKRGSQYKHKLCPNSEAASFEGCIWRPNSKPIWRLHQMQSQNASFVSRAMKDTTDGSFMAQTIARFNVRQDFLRENVGLHF